jgi:hypothetical protein
VEQILGSGKPRWENAADNGGVVAGGSEVGELLLDVVAIDDRHTLQKGL